MKRIIDIDKPTFDDIIATNSIEGHFGRVDWCIRNSKPYEERKLSHEQECIIEELENICINNEYVLGLLAKLKNGGES